jgi:hypothetical protein
MSPLKKPRLSQLNDEELHDIVRNNPNKLHETGMKIAKALKEIDRKPEEYKY